jgi:hypothetical protein
MSIKLDRIVAIANDLKNDTEWVNDSHSEYEHRGVVHGLDRLISHLKEIKATDVERFNKIKLAKKRELWFNLFVDFIQDNHRNIYNNACEYADEIESTKKTKS